MVNINLEEVTGIKPVTDEKQEKHLYNKPVKQKKKKETKKEKKKEEGRIIDIYA